MLFSKLNRSSGIYQILNLINNKFYIGSAIDFYERYHSHLHYLNKNSHHNEHLQRAYLKYDNKNFKFEIIEFCKPELLIEREQFWIDHKQAVKLGYSIRVTANSNAGLKFTTEHRARMSAWQIGRTLSDETKDKISISLKGRRRTHVSIEKQRLTVRSPDSKLTCADGWKCKCNNCKIAIKEYHRNYMKNKRIKIKLATS